MNQWNDAADAAYRAEIARAEGLGQIAAEGSALAAAREAVLDEIRGNPAAYADLEQMVADAAAQRAHHRAIEAGKRRIDELSTGQLRFGELDALDFVVPLGEGAISTGGNLDDQRIDMADELRRQNLFRVQRKYQEWSDGFRRPAKDALRPMPPGSTLNDAVEQGRL